MVPRVYTSPLRAAQAEQTRHRILGAAAELFATAGYAATSMAQIGAAAQVSTETVKANGPKSALLLAAFDQAFSGAEGVGAINERETGNALLRHDDADLLDALVAFVSGANQRVARLWTAVVEAANSDSAVAVELEQLQGRRRSDFRAAVAAFRARGLARRPDPDDELADALSFLVSPEGYTQLVLDSGWSVTRYRTWLAATIQAVVLDP